jgi:hypothetical protein
VNEVSIFKVPAGMVVMTQENVNVTYLCNNNLEWVLIIVETSAALTEIIVSIQIEWKILVAFFH